MSDDPQLPDWLKRFEVELEAKGQAFARRRRRHRRRWVAGSAVLALIAVPTVAYATGAWDPPLGRPAVDGAVRASNAPVLASVRNQLSVLRRAQTPEDRRVAEPLLRTLNARTDGVQTDEIRALGDSWALVPVTSVAAAVPFRDGLCLTDGEAIVCQPTTVLDQDGVRVSIARGTATQLVGLVPDPVASVRFTPTEGSAVQTQTQANFYSITAPITRPSSTIKAPDGYEGTAAVLAPPLPAGGTLQWLDRAGAVIGPRHQKVG